MGERLPRTTRDANGAFKRPLSFPTNVDLMRRSDPASILVVDGFGNLYMEHLGGHIQELPVIQQMRSPDMSRQRWMGSEGQCQYFRRRKQNPQERRRDSSLRHGTYEANKNAQSEGIPIPEHNSFLSCSFLFLPEMLERQAK